MALVAVHDERRTSHSVSSRWDVILMGAEGEWSASTGTYGGKNGESRKYGRKSEKTDEYDIAIMDYNAAYTDLSDAGMTLLRERERSVDLIRLVEHLVNSIANTPKEYKTDFELVDAERREFTESEEFARQELAAARKSATGAGAGLAAGTAVVSMAPSAAMWIATTFGTASTGTAISTLSGAAATNAALAWLGGGALAAGGGGMAAGNALLALAGPIGWTIAGASVLTSIVLLARKKRGIAKRKNEELAAVKRNAASLRETTVTISSILDRTVALRDALASWYMVSVRLFDEDYRALDEGERLTLGSLVNDTVTLARLLNERVDASQGSGGAQ